MKLPTIAAVLTVSSVAIADPVDAPPAPKVEHPFEVGARIGGYGFRREGADQTKAWSECRMNGFGIFGTRALRGPLFVEAGIDMYSSVTSAQEPGDLPIDRTSGLLSTSIGARTNITRWLRGYAQLGGGFELAHVSVPYGETRIRDNKVMPEGFFGFGAEINLGQRTRIGSNFRTHVMGNFDYDPSRLDMSQGWIAAPSTNEVFDASPDVATQVQFYVRREL